MATRLKNSTATLAATGWVGGIVPNTSDIVFYGTDVGALSSLTAWGDTSANCSAFHLSTAYPHAAWTMTDASTGANFNVANNTEKVDGVYSLYIAAGKTFSMNRGLRVDGQFDDLHKFYIDGALILNPNSTTGFIRSRDDQGNLRIEKYGTGYMWIARTQSGAAGFLYYYGGYTIRDGEIRLGGNTSDFPLGRTQNTVTDNRLIFNIATSGADPVLRFVVDSGSTRIVPNNVVMDTRGRITTDNGFTATMQGTATGSGVLTVGPASPFPFGNVVWENNISCPLNVTGLLTMGTGRNLTGSTLTGTGTVAMSSTGTISGDVSGVTISGNYIRAVVGSRTDSGNNTGYPQFVNPPTGGAGTLTISGTWTGSLDTVWSDAANRKAVTVTGKLQGTGFPNGALRLGTEATISQSGATSEIRGTVSLGYGATFALANTAAGIATLTTVTGPGYPDHYVTADASATSYSGNITSPDTSGSFFIDVADGGTLSLTGSAQTFSTGNAARKFRKRQPGRLKVTGRLTVTTAPFDVDDGILEISTASPVAFNAGLTIKANKTLSCAASNAAYAAQLSGNLTLEAGSTMKFGIA